MANADLAHASDEECLLLIKLKRQHAKAAMKDIVVRFGLPPHYLPKIPTILEYLTNMVYCLELMLKLLSGNWRTHNVGAMWPSSAIPTLMPA